MTKLYRNKANPANMRVAVRWEGCNDTKFVSDRDGDHDGLSWEAVKSFEKGNGPLRKNKGVLDKWLAKYSGTVHGKPQGAHVYPFKKTDDYVAISANKYSWIRNDPSLKWTLNSK